MSNLAAALLKMQRYVLVLGAVGAFKLTAPYSYEAAISAADRAIMYEPKNIKARYRRGLAQKNVGV